MILVASHLCHYCICVPIILDDMSKNAYFLECFFPDPWNILPVISKYFLKILFDPLTSPMKTSNHINASKIIMKWVYRLTGGYISSAP